MPIFEYQGASVKMLSHEAVLFAMGIEEPIIAKLDSGVTTHVAPGAKPKQVAVQFGNELRRLEERRYHERRTYDALDVFERRSHDRRSA